jgi:hypothetical protein
MLIEPRNLTYARRAAAFCWLLALPQAIDAADVPRAPLPLHGQSKAVFATAEQARELLGKRDAFTEALGPLERKIRMRRAEIVTTDELLTDVQADVLEWDEESIKRMGEVLAALGESLKPLNLNLPPEILFIKTNGEQESGAAYTRSNGIVLPKGRLDDRPGRLERLVAHELFHVISRHDPELRRELYGLIGFAPCEPVMLPGELAELKITNPDAPTIDYFITIEHEGQKLPAVPVLFSDKPDFDPRLKSFLDYLQFRLMAIEMHEGRWRPLTREGRPVLIDVTKNKSFHDQIGGNTAYIIHPDEIMADNFVHMLLQTKDLPTPKLVEAMRAILTRERGASAP